LFGPPSTHNFSIGPFYSGGGETHGQVYWYDNRYDGNSGIDETGIAAEYPCLSCPGYAAYADGETTFGGWIGFGNGLLSTAEIEVYAEGYDLYENWWEFEGCDCDSQYYDSGSIYGEC
jgi:hypothetical protein